MPTDLEIIKQLEKEIGITLEEVKKFEESKNAYQIDTEQKVVGLVLTEIKLSRFPKAILQLKYLTKLTLYGTQLNVLPPEILDLTKLTLLNLSANPFKILPSPISAIKNLTTLWLVGIQMSRLPEEIVQLENLKRLNLYGNRLTTFPKELTQLKNLIELRLGQNQLTHLLREISQLKNLSTLDLWNNQLTHLPREISQLKNLSTLNLMANQLTHLPREIIQLKNLKELNVSRNPLKQPPPEIVKQGTEAILEYLRQLSDEEDKRKEAHNVNEAKLILVGQGDVGKTCLAKRLKFDTFQKEETTEGIDIIPWEITAPTKKKETIRLNMWDFGGQEIYHATHQFFLTKRSVYFLVWNARKAQDFENIHYWLHTIEAFGEDSPIILVMSKCRERDDDLNLKDLKEQFPQIIGLYKTDSKDGTGIPQLKEITADIAWKLPHMQTPWVESWFNVREQLEQDGRDWITCKEFHRVCDSHGLDRRQMDILDSYLHDLWVIIHFKDILELQNMVILKPEWATDPVYKILDTDSVKKRGGVLRHGELNQIWDTDIYPADIYPQLLKLMERFELAYELPDKKSHLVAELLPKSEPGFAWPDRENLHFYYTYDFLPAGVITRFIVRVHQDLEPGPDGRHLCWREGAVLQREDTRARVKMKPLEKRIEISIEGANKRELLAIIRHQLDHINESIKKVKIIKQIPCNCSPGCPHPWDYDDLLRGEKIGVESVRCMKSFNKTTITSMLDGYEKKTDRQKYKEEYLKYGEVLGHDSPIRPSQMVVIKENNTEPPPKKKWYQTIWGILIGLGALLGIVWTAIQLIEWINK